MSWIHTPLAELAEVITKGTTPTTIGHEFTETGIPFLRVQNIAGGKVNFERDTLFIDERTHETLSRSRIRPGDLLVSIAGSIGRAGIVPMGSPALNCNQAVAIVRPKEKVYRPFLRFWIESSGAQQQIRNSTVTGTISNLSLSQLSNLQIPLPPLAEQRRIAEVLDKVEALRAKRRAALAQLDSLTKSLFLDLFGDPLANPKGWRVSPLSEVGEIHTGKTPPTKLPGMFGGKIPFATPGDLDEGLISTERTLTADGSKYSKVVRAGSTLVGCIGNIGKIAKTPVSTAFNQQINAVEWGVQIDDDYGIAALGFQKQQMLSYSSSTVVPILNKSGFSKVTIPVPPLSLQREFARRVTALEALKTAQRAALAELDALFASLQHRAFRGEL